MNDKTVILLSGGIDSAVALYWAQREGGDLLALTLANNHRGTNAVEVACALLLAGYVRAAHAVVDFSLTEVMLRNVPFARFAVGGEMGGCTRSGTQSAAMSIEFMHIGAMFYAVNHGASRVLWSIHADDLKDSNHEEVLRYLDFIEKIVRLRSGTTCRLEAPFLSFHKNEVIELGSKLKIPFEDTFSCLENDTRVHCGKCEQCVKRIEAFRKAGLLDPARFEGTATSLEAQLAGVSAS